MWSKMWPILQRHFSLNVLKITNYALRKIYKIFPYFEGLLWLYYLFLQNYMDMFGSHQISQSSVSSRASLESLYYLFYITLSSYLRGICSPEDFSYQKEISFKSFLVKSPLTFDAPKAISVASYKPKYHTFVSRRRQEKVLLQFL